MSTHKPSTHCHSITGVDIRRRANVLLESVLAMVVMAMGIGAIAALLDHSMRTAEASAAQVRARLLAEDKYAQLQSGLMDLEDQQEGDFGGLEPGFTWEMTSDESSIQGIRIVTVTVKWQDGRDKLQHELTRLYSPTMNMSLDRMANLADDPTALAEVGDQQLQDIIGMVNELPHSDKLVKMALAGQYEDLIELYNRIINGQDISDLIDEEQLLGAITGEQIPSDGTDQSGEDGDGDYLTDKMGSGTKAAATSWDDLVDDEGLLVPQLAKADGEQQDKAGIPEENVIELPAGPNDKDQKGKNKGGKSGSGSDSGQDQPDGQGQSSDPNEDVRNNPIVKPGEEPDPADIAEKVEGIDEATLRRMMQILQEASNRNRRR